MLTSCRDSDNNSDNIEENESSTDNVDSFSDTDSGSSDGDDRNLIKGENNADSRPRLKTNMNKHRNSKTKNATSNLRRHSKNCNDPKTWNENIWKGRQPAEFGKQWQIIKSMRKRQEVALRAAEKEREDASHVYFRLFDSRLIIIHSIILTIWCFLRYFFFIR